MSDKKKKKFAETGFGQFVTKNVPELAKIADQLITGGKVSGFIDVVRNQIEGNAAEGNEQAKIALAELDMKRKEWEKEMAQIYIQELSISVDDRKSAREMQIESIRAGKKEYMPAVLSFAALIFFGFMLITIIYRVVPAENRELFIHCLGIVEGAMLTGTYNFWLGTSVSSRRKTELLSKNQPEQ
jgi:hypothetical protein